MNNGFEFFEKLNLPKEIAKNQLFLVGGAVRSIICENRLPRDIDICGNFSTEDFANIDLESKQYIKQLYSLRFKWDKYDIDLTAFRKEEYKRGYFPSRVERVSTPEEDSLRRDFTINAIYLNQKGDVLDFHNSLEHLKGRKIVAITPQTLNVDGMRIYRMVRFALTLGFEIEKDTLESALFNKNNILQIKKERGMVEFNKFKEYITSDNIEIIDSLGILSHLEISKNQLMSK